MIPISFKYYYINLYIEETGRLLANDCVVNDCNQANHSSPQTTVSSSLVIFFCGIDLKALLF
jgi:hypothetical protein